MSNTSKIAKCQICGVYLKKARGILCTFCGGEYYALKKQKRYINLSKEELYKMTRQNIKRKRQDKKDKNENR